MKLLFHCVYVLVLCYELNCAPLQKYIRICRSPNSQYIRIRPHLEIMSLQM